MAELETRAVREQANDAGGVELLTLHRAKGLEWEAVFLPSLEEGSLPVSHAGDDWESIAEERRLLYVGITRARRYLTLTWAQQRVSSSGSCSDGRCRDSSEPSGLRPRLRPARVTSERSRARAGCSPGAAEHG